MAIEKEYAIPESWNWFITKTIGIELCGLNDIEKNSVLTFRYNASMNSGGHSDYFDCYPEVNYQELYEALITIGVPEVANNFQKAILLNGEGEDEEYLQTDSIFYDLEADFTKKLMDYVETHKNEMNFR